MSEYKTAKSRINNAKTISELEELDVNIMYIYDIGLFTVREYQKLDILIMEKIAKIGE
jgi:hypothetical protein